MEVVTHLMKTKDDRRVSSLPYIWRTAISKGQEHSRYPSAYLDSDAIVYEAGAKRRLYLTQTAQAQFQCQFKIQVGQINKKNVFFKLCPGQGVS